MINFIILCNSLGQPRLIRRYGKTDETSSEAEVIKQCLKKDQSRECFMFKYKCQRIVYLKFGSIFVIASTDEEENDLAICEFISNFMEITSSYLGEMTECSIMQNVDKLYMILDEMVVHGKIMGSSKTHILSPVQVLASS